jgi:hypothetical protein
MMTLGEMVALILAELGIPGFDLLLSDLILVLIILLISYSIVSEKKFNFLNLLLFIAGVSHGLSFVHDINIIELQPLQRIQALFAFNLAIDLGQYVFALGLLLALPFLKKKLNNTKWFPVLTGSVSVFLVLLIFSENIIAGKLQILNVQTSPVSVTYQNPAQFANLSTRQVQRGKGLMTTPLKVYLSVEPYEIREEILIQALVVQQYLSFLEKELKKIPVELQEQIKKEIQEIVSFTNTIYVDNQLLTPADNIVNFVTLNRGGVATREIPVEEELEDAILGITLIYDIESFPDSISLNWDLFPDTVQHIEASVVDPHGAFTTMLAPTDNVLNWKNRLVGYRVPAIEAIEVEKQPKPLISLLLWFGVLSTVIYQGVYNRSFGVKRWIIIVFVMGFILYPFIRSSVKLPFLPHGKPSVERANVILNDLLTNVYRAFDRRNEDDVYDRLALSVTGNQLTEIYIQNRQSMALENRGGARANVDDVMIQKLNDINRHKNGGYVADVQWTVRGSVNHFGHTHYRQNQYRALVSFGIDSENWKITDIEILDMNRMY